MTLRDRILAAMFAELKRQWAKDHSAPLFTRIEPERVQISGLVDLGQLADAIVLELDEPQTPPQKLEHF